MTRLLAISGSVRRGSHNRELLRAAEATLPPGAELVRWDGLATLPHYDADLDGADPPAAVAELRDALTAADGLLVATPEYSHSIPGSLKNALDWASRPFPDNALRDLPAAVIGASTGLFGAVWAQAEVRKVLSAAGAQVLDEELPVGTAHEAFTPAGALADPTLATELDRIAAGLVGAARDRRAIAA